MKVYYHHVAGHSLERLAALSDGIFSVAMTLLVLNISVPVGRTLQSQQIQALWQSGAVPQELALWNALVPLAPKLLTYLMSFLTLGIFWVGHQTQLNHFEKSNRHLTWIHLIFLLGVSLMPFSTALLAAFITYRIALVVYWLNLLWLGIMLFASCRYAHHAGLIKHDTPQALRDALERRIIIAQGLYAFAVLLCVFNTYVSIAILVGLQLNSVIAPRVFPLDRF